MPTRNLRPHQWQIGDLVFGRGTQYRVLGTKIQTYNVNNQDFQVPLSDEVRMGQDTFQAGPITFKIGVVDNAPMPHVSGHLPANLVDRSAKLLTALQKEWKADEIKQQWGALKPLIHCDGYGSVRRIYGRPRKFEYSPKTETSQFYVVNAEYARVDTLSYTDTEYYVQLVNGAAPVSYTRDGGDAPAWFRVLFTGPMSNPLVIVGDNQIQLQLDIQPGVVVEVSSYPWARRIIDSNGINWRTALVGASKYLDQMRIPPDTPQQMSLTATGTTDDSACLVLWRDAYNVV